jgi:hypothetical protein
METVRSNKVDLRKLELFKPRLRRWDYLDKSVTVPASEVWKSPLADQSLPQDIDIC